MNESVPQESLPEQMFEQKLKSAESPYTWMPNREGFENVRPGYILEISVRKPYNSNLSIYLKYMQKVFELGNLDDPSAIEAMWEWEEFYGDIGASDNFFTKYKNALEHVIYSSKVHLLLKMSDYNQVEQLVESIETLNDGSDSFKACINGLKAKFFYSYCYEGRLRALPYAKEALRLDPDEIEWIVITGKTMRGIRKSQFQGSKQSRYEELELFKKCVSIKETGSNLINLGFAYLDVGNYLDYERKVYNNHKCKQSDMCGSCLIILKHFLQGVGYFNDAIKADPNQYIYCQVVKGIITIPGFYRYMFTDIARNCVDKILDDIHKGIIDDEYASSVYYIIGKYYKHVEKKVQESVKYITKSAELGGTHARKDLIYMKYNIDLFYDPRDDIYQLMNVYQCGPMMVECICQLASYNLSINDLSRAVECVLQVKEYDPTFKYTFLKNFRSWFRKGGSINLLKEITAKVLPALRLLSEDTTEFKKLTDFIKLVREIDPDIASVHELDLGPD